MMLFYSHIALEWRFDAVVKHLNPHSNVTRANIRDVIPGIVFGNSYKENNA